MKNTSRLPNLRNLGVALRILIIANLALILGAFILTDGINAFMDQLTGTSAFAQPILLISLFLLYSAYHPLSKMPYRRAILSILILIALSATAVHAFFSQFWIFTELPSLTRMVLYAWMISAPTLYYFNLLPRSDRSQTAGATGTHTPTLSVQQFKRSTVIDSRPTQTSRNRTGRYGGFVPRIDGRKSRISAYYAGNLALPPISGT